MGKKNKKKSSAAKKKSKKAGAESDEFLAEAKEEMVALEAIFDEEFEAHEDGGGFNLTIVPHPGEAESNFVSVQLVVRYPPQYPAAQVTLKLEQASGLEAADVRRVAKLMHTAAAAYAKQEEICVFNLVTIAQEQLQELNQPPDEGDKQVSLWHEMQARDATEGEAVLGPSEDSAELREAWEAVDFDFAGGLFDEEGSELQLSRVRVPEKRTESMSNPSLGNDVSPLSAAGSGPSQGPHAASGSASPFADKKAESDKADEGPPLDPSSPLAADHDGGSHQSSQRKSASSSDATEGSSRTGLGASSGDLEPPKSKGPPLSIDHPNQEDEEAAYSAPQHLTDVSSDRSFSDGSDDEDGEKEGDDDEGEDEESSSEESDVSEEERERHVRTSDSGSGSDHPGSGAQNVNRLWQSPGSPSSSSAAGESSSWTSFSDSSKTRMIMGGNSVMIPRQVARLLRGTSNASQSSSMANASSSEFQQAQLRQELLMGHLVLMAASSQPPSATRALVNNLQENNLMARWVGHCILHQPKLFQKAFTRAFGSEGQWLAKLPEASTSILKNFWQIGGGGPAFARQGMGQRAVSGEYSSRYETDFQELRKLGSGGFGVVMSAINRLDGRKYAVKRIPLPTAQPAALTRIMREVTTLSRLQHPGIVRYFQAWREVYMGDDDGSSETDEDDAWESSATSATRTGHTRTGTHSARPGADVLGRSFAKSRNFMSPFFYEASASQRSSALTANKSDKPPRRRKSFDGISSPTATPSAGFKMQEVLYIQMEFCTRTLHEVINQDGGLEEVDAWEVMRQILSALANVHSQGIIHRDLKPANIFYDAKGDIKLGDFGLAKHSDGEERGFHPDHGDVLGSSSSSGKPPDSKQGLRVAPDSTGVCGTTVYISPEIAQGWAEYDDKVDIYSLGIIAFEMWHPFETAMERYILLRALRERGELPTEWELEHSQVASMIRWLTSPNPEERPTAAQVLHSDILPPLVGDEQLKDLLRSLPDNPVAHGRTVDAIFEIATEASTLDSAYGSSSGQDARMPGTPGSDKAYADAKQQVIKAIKGSLDAHGAVAMSSSLIGLAHPMMPKQAPCLLAKSSTLLAMRHEMRYPFATWLSTQALNNRWHGDALRRYEVASVHRAVASNSIPREYLQVDLDLVSPLGNSLPERLLAEAEVVKALTEVLEDIGPATGAYEVRISHNSLLQGAMQYIGATKEQQPRAMELLINQAASSSPLSQDVRSKRWYSVKVALEGLGLSSSAIKRAKQMLVVAPGDSETAIARLSNLLPKHGRKANGDPGGEAAFLQELRIFLEHLQAWGLPSQSLTIDPLMAPHADYFSGIIFQLHVSLPHSGWSRGGPQGTPGNAPHGPATHVVAVGGRYDGLMRSLWPRSGCAVPPPGAVGATINAERLVTLCRIHNRKSQGSGTTPELQLSNTDVLVCARGGGGLLRERMTLVSALWAKHIRAELLHAASPSLTEQYQYASAHGVKWLVTLEEARLRSADMVTVKCLERRIEEHVAYPEVAKYLQQALDANSAGAVPRQRGAVLAPLQSPASGSVAEDAATQDDDAVPSSASKKASRGSRRGAAGN